LLSFLTLYVTAVGTAWSLLFSCRNGQAALQTWLFENRFLSWQCIQSWSYFGRFERDGKCL